jgi:hypothetical protein
MRSTPRGRCVYELHGNLGGTGPSSHGEAKSEAAQFVGQRELAVELLDRVWGGVDERSGVVPRPAPHRKERGPGKNPGPLFSG